MLGLHTQVAVEEAGNRLKMQELTGIKNEGKEGLGLHQRVPFSKASKKEKRKMLVSTIGRWKRNREL